MSELNYNYNKKNRDKAVKLRKQSTKSEIRLWCEVLRNRQLLGYQFLRQRPIGYYIADFFCKELNLIIECDGVTHLHDVTYEKDVRRDQYLKDLGIDVIRFNDDIIMNNIEGVKITIENWIKDNRKSSPELRSPPSKGD